MPAPAHHNLRSHPRLRADRVHRRGQHHASPRRARADRRPALRGRPAAGRRRRQDRPASALVVAEQRSGRTLGRDRRLSLFVLWMRFTHGRLQVRWWSDHFARNRYDGVIGLSQGAAMIGLLVSVVRPGRVGGQGKSDERAAPEPRTCTRLQPRKAGQVQVRDPLFWSAKGPSHGSETTDRSTQASSPTIRRIVRSMTYHRIFSPCTVSAPRCVPR